MADAPARTTSPAAWLRGFVAPAMAAGLVLVLVGSVGSAGLLGGLAGTAANFLGESDNSARGPELVTDSTDSVGAEPGAVAASQSPGESLRAQVAPSQSPEDLVSPSSEGNSGQPWAVVILLGIVLLGGGLTLRYVVVPRAG